MMAELPREYGGSIIHLTSENVCEGNLLEAIFVAIEEFSMLIPRSSMPPIILH